MSANLKDLMSDEVMGGIMGRLLGIGRPLTAKEFRAYVKVQAKLQQENEINEATSVLEAAGYTVIEPE